MSKVKEALAPQSYSFLDYVNKSTTECCNRIENLGGTVDMLMGMSHRDSYELRRTARQLKHIVAKLERKAKEIDGTRRPKKCDECGINYADPPSKICPGCEAYREHQA